MYLTATQAESNEQEKHRHYTIEMPVSAMQQQQAEPPSSCVLAVGSWQPDSLVTFAIGTGASSLIFLDDGLVCWCRGK